MGFCGESNVPNQSPFSTAIPHRNPFKKSVRCPPLFPVPFRINS